ncbi:MAG: hypothetical protein MGF17_09240, partial [Trichodesmium sp. MAG_R04]|nr:hypothetical protein [Trichodesmium sp. MAG_R04]
NEAGQLMGIHVGVTKKVDGDGKGVLVSTFLRDMPQQVSRVKVGDEGESDRRITSSRKKHIFQHIYYSEIFNITNYLFCQVLQQNPSIRSTDIKNYREIVNIPY